MATAGRKKLKERKDKILAAVVTFPVWEAAVEAAEKDGRTVSDWLGRLIIREIGK